MAAIFAMAFFNSMSLGDLSFFMARQQKKDVVELILRKSKGLRFYDLLRRIHCDHCDEKKCN
jgi:hypothetical protein